MGTTPDSQNADHWQLFDDSPAYTCGAPLVNGFYELEPPDNWRWIMPEAECKLPAPRDCFARPALVVRALPGRFKWVPYLSVFINGTYVETQPVPAYGSYWFEVEPSILKKTDEGGLTVSLRTNNAENEVGSERKLSLAIYEVRLIDLDASARFDERDLFLEQLAVFEGETGLSKALHDAKLGSCSRILDVGAGSGWSSVLLALYTGARVVAVDVYQYDAPTGVAFRTELRRRLSRHVSELQRRKAFAQNRGMAGVESAIDRCTFLTMNAEELWLRDGLFDFAFSLNSFEHIPRPDCALAEIRRTLRPGGEAFVAFSPAYYSDQGHHLHSGDLLNLPWVHLLHDRDEIKRMIAHRGKPTNEVDSILNSLNGWRPNQFETMYRLSGMEIVSHQSTTGFSIPGAKDSDAFRILSKRFPLKDLTTIGMQTHLRKPT